MENLETSPETLDEYTSYETLWQGRTITIRYNPNWLGGIKGMQTQHIEIKSSDNEPLPITETGYRSHFLNGTEALADFNHDPVRFVLAWLDTAAESKTWQDYEKQSRQGSLF